MARRAVAVLGVLALWAMGGGAGGAAAPTTEFPVAQQVTNTGIKEHEVVPFWFPWDHDGKRLFYTVIRSNPEIWAFDIDHRRGTPARRQHGGRQDVIDAHVEHELGA